MPINIYKLDEKRTKISYLCRDVWRLPEQVAALEKWVARRKTKEPVGCVADIGFCWRKDAGGGGSCLTPEFMKKMADSQLSLFLSEYPGYAESGKKNK